MRMEFRARVVTDEGERLFGEGPYRLLRGVERLGSLRAAAGELGMAYSKANRIMGRAERLLGAPLTRRRIGGPDGGGSALTPLARELLARYDALRADCEAAVQASFARNFGDLPVMATSAASDSNRPPREETHPSGNSPHAEEGQRQSCRESACEAMTGGEASSEPSRRVGEEPSAKADCSRLIVKEGERRMDELEHTTARRDAAVSESSCRSSEEPSTVPECSLRVEEGDKQGCCESACNAAMREAAPGEPSRRPGEEPSAAMSCSRSISKVGERHLDESACGAEERREAAPSGLSHRSDGATFALGCVVLAAGRARRFGGGKLLAELGGRPVLARTLDALPRDCFCRTVVVTSDPAVSALCRELGFPAREYPGGALSDSIREGLAEMDGTDGCAFVNGDQPLLCAASLRRLAAAFASDPDHVYRLAHGGTAASPVAFPASAYPALRALTGERGGMAALKSGDWEICTVEAEEEFELWDVDDPAALERAEARLREDSRG